MSYPLIIGSDLVETTNRLRVVSPYDGSQVSTAAQGDASHLRRAIDVAHAAFEVTRRLRPFERAAALRRLVQGIEQQRTTLARLIMQEAGKPIALAEAEVDRALVTFSTAATLAQESMGHLLDLEAAPPGAGHTGFARRVPIGVVYGITPFNFPLNLVAHKVAPALATGNPIIIKPSPHTPLTALFLGQLARQSQITPGAFNVVTCSNEEAAIPLSDERVRMVTFTGSARVGWQIKAQCPRIRVTLELGSNAAAIVHEDAVLDKAIPTLAAGAYAYAGQSCISTQRIYVHAPVYDTFRARFVEWVQSRIKTGDPSDRDVLVGPVINAAARDRVLRWIEAAVAGGARVVHGGRVTGPCLEATVVEVPHDNFDLCQEEAFAPIVTLHRYEAFDDALQAVNRSRYGIQAGVFTQDISRAWRAYDRLDVGSVLVNQAPTFRTDNQPYGGVKESGFGREGVRYAMEEMTDLKSLIVRPE